MLPDTPSLPESGNIVSRWKLDEASGARADDVGSNNLTDNNTVGSGTGPFDDTCADFELGNTEFLNITDGAQSGLDFAGDMSISFWINLETTGIQNEILSKWGANDANRAYRLRYNTGGNFDMEVRDGIGVTKIEGSKAFSITTGIWYHVLIVLDVSAQDITLYVDGQSEGLFSISTATATAILDSNADFELGARTDGSLYLDGLMQDAIMWNDELTASDASDLYDAYFITRLVENDRTPIRGVGRGIMRP